MSIRSMTGFSRVEGRAGSISWHWEVRSVNARGLDIRQRLAPGMDALEPQVREAVARHLVRGSVNVSLSLESRDGIQEIRLNETVLLQVLKAIERINKLTDTAPPSADGLMSIKGVLEITERVESPAEIAERTAAMLATLEEALGALVEARTAEGNRLRSILYASLQEMERLVELIETSTARSPSAIERRLSDQLGRLLDPANGFDAARLHQEAVMIATRIDVEEELKRLRAHIQAANELLQQGGAVGRKLDFLAQEFNREANTLCAKANDVEITRSGLALKAVIDQMREQVQNIE